MPSQHQLNSWELESISTRSQSMSERRKLERLAKSLSFPRAKLCNSVVSQQLKRPKAMKKKKKRKRTGRTND